MITKEDIKGLESKLDEIMSLFKPLQIPGNNSWQKSSDVKKLLKISDGTLKKYRDNGTIPYRKIGGSFYYSSESVMALFKKPDFELDNKLS